MSDDLIPDDATLVDVWRSLPDGAGYVRQIARNLKRQERQDRPLRRLRLRLGITGRGIHPNYRIELASFDHDDPRRDEGVLDFIPPVPIGVYRGATHQPIARPNAIELNDAHWSRAVIDMAEMREVLAIVRESA